MRALFIYPEIQSSITNTATYSLPLGLGAVATFCRQIFGDRLEVKILDGSMMTHAEQLTELDSFQPEIVGFSPTIASVNHAYTLAKQAKDAGALVLFGGVNSTNLWHQMLANCGFIDAVVLFEGEEAMAEVVRRRLAKISGDALLSGIPNVAYRDANGTVIGPEKVRVFGLNELPDIDYALFDLPRYFKQTELRGFGRAVSYYAGKGCAKRSTTRLQSVYQIEEYTRCVRLMNTCSFCGRNEPGFRTLPADREADLLRQLHDVHGVRGFFNVQDTVNLHCEESVELDDSWFRLFIGVESITRRNIARLQHRYGSNLIFQTGVESVSPSVRRSMGKVAVTENGLLAKVEMLSKHNIQLHASFIFGGRNETVKSMQATAKLARHLADFLNVTWILISPQIILPGSPDYRRLLKMPGMRAKWGNVDIIDIADISRDFIKHFAPELTREKVLEEIGSVFEDIRAKTPNRKLVLDIKGVMANEEASVNPRRYYCDR